MGGGEDFPAARRRVPGRPARFGDDQRPGPENPPGQPVLGMAAIAVPIYYLFRPSPPVQPYDWFPWVAVGLIVVFILYSIWLVRRDPGLGDRVGSIVADE
jgi:hypothetical protein